MPGDCAMCPRRIRPGQPIGLCFDLDLWVHIGCLVRWINEKKRAEEVA